MESLSLKMDPCNCHVPKGTEKVHVEYIGTLWVGWEGDAVASFVPWKWINN